jgi:hypothetical protein
MIIVDFNQTAISSFMAEVRGRSDVEINVPLMRHMILNQLRSYKHKFGAEFGDMVIACDNRHYWRRKVFPNYKYSRKKVRDDSGFDWGSIFEALNAIRNEIDQFLPYPVIDVHGAEADDVIGVLAEYSQTAKQGVLFEEAEPVLIISGDHDFNQLQKWSNVKQYSPVKKKFIKITESAEAVLMEHIITGDKGDGVPNMLSPDDCFVTGTRQKPIRKVLLEEWKTMRPEEFVTGDMAAGYVRNKQLVDLSMTPDDIKEAVIESYESQLNKDKSQLLNYFIKYKLKGMIDVAEDF